jgi:hypothetical protein
MAKKHILPTDVTPQGFLKEVDDALQEEKMLALWNEWRWLIVTVVIGLLLGTALGQGWQAWRRHQDQAVAEQWYALSKMKPEDAGYAAKLKAMEDVSPPGYHALALYAQADQLMNQTTPDAKGAAMLYGVVAKDSSMPEWLRDLSTLNAAVVLMGTDDAAAKADLDALVAKPKSGMYPSALELSAVLAVKRGDTVLARDFTQKLLATPYIPADMRQRALRRMGDLSTIAR